ncbi:glycosyltransferase [Vicingus serpentipes]|uniref:Glycosyltransferase n=1 Tax=Vicingus serpentipes TaxID=1926625 RepID=A0A5C6RRW7_9FLAO|nr:glycosyltransferase [Vicingus serpentipes]TXB65101.1 glycosyltransferase [Vicingus serpentipes]
MFNNLSDNFLFIEFNDVFDYLVLGFLIIAFIQLMIYLFIFSRLAFFKNKNETSNKSEPISVIICAKNERDNLLKFLPDFLNQDYPNFEVIVVNDHSVDDTEDVLKAYTMQFKHLKVVNVPDNDRFYGSKKFALTLGIKAAQYDNVLLTDADCKPASKKWIQLMSEYAANKKIILGFGAYEKQKGLLNKLIRFDTLFTATQYLSFALLKLPYMGVGRNLAYNKELFFSVKGFSSHQHILSGDDDLFVNEVANSKNTQIVIEEEAHTVSVPKATFKLWLRQKKRHFSTGKYYKFGHKLMLSIYPLTLLIFVLLFISLVIQQISIHLIVGVFLLRLLIQLLIFIKIEKRLGSKDLWFLAPILELFFMFFNPLLLISNFIKKNTKWS